MTDHRKEQNDRIIAEAREFVAATLRTAQEVENEVRALRLRRPVTITITDFSRYGDNVVAFPLWRARHVR